jgi:hypothetical protein
MSARLRSSVSREFSVFDRTNHVSRTAKLETRSGDVTGQTLLILIQLILSLRILARILVSRLASLSRRERAWALVKERQNISMACWVAIGELIRRNRRSDLKVAVEKRLISDNAAQKQRTASVSTARSFR